MILNIAAPIVPAFTSDAETNAHLENIYLYLTALSGTLNRVLAALEDSMETGALTEAYDGLSRRVAALEEAAGE